MMKLRQTVNFSQTQSDYNLKLSNLSKWFSMVRYGLLIGCVIYDYTELINRMITLATDRITVGKQAYVVRRVTTYKNLVSLCWLCSGQPNFYQLSNNIPSRSEPTFLQIEQWQCAYVWARARKSLLSFRIAYILQCQFPIRSHAIA